MSEVNKLAHQIALESACTIIECHTLHVKDIGEDWFDLNDTELGVPLGIFLKDELRYLTLRDALRWHPSKPNLVRIVEVAA